MNNRRELFVAGSIDDLAREAARRLVELANAAIQSHGFFAVALSGGTTPRRLYQLLTQAPYRQAIDWSRVHLFFADERFVPHSDPDSTAKLVRDTLLDGMPIPPENFKAMPTEGATPEVCAAEYANALSSFLGSPTPVFDLVLLGMGPDGHTASLFPGHPDHAGSVAVVYESPKPPPVRLTLTLGTIRQARHVLFLVSGADKAETLKAVFESQPEDDKALPAARVMASDGTSAWLTDPEAASLIGNR